MAQTEKVGILRAFFQWLKFWDWGKGREILDSAHGRFTKSPQGISHAFDIHQDRLVGEYREMRNAVGSLELVIEQDRQRLESLNKEEDDHVRRRDGALRAVEATAETDPERAKHVAAFERFDSRIQEIEAEQASLESKIASNTTGIKGYLSKLTAMQSEIQRMPGEKARQIAEFVSNQKIIELNERLQGIQTSMDRGPIEAVLKANRELSARARVSEKLAGTDVQAQDEDYARMGSGSRASDRMAQMLAARKAEREGTSVGAAPSKDSVKVTEPGPERRPKI